MSNEKTDNYFVATMLVIGLFGIVLYYYGRIIHTVWEKADYTSLQVEMMRTDQQLLIEHVECINESSIDP